MAKIETSVAARILGWHVNTVLKWRKLGKLKAERKSSAKQAPWVYEREQIIILKNANIRQRA